MPRNVDMTHHEHQSGGPIAASISNAVVRTLGEYTGRGPTKARTYVNQDAVTVVLEDTLTKGERRLVAEGNASIVLNTRSVFQEMMRPDLVTSVEELTGRTVSAFVSANHIDPDMGVETFILERLEDTPSPATG